MYMGLYEWTISRSADRSYRAFRVDGDGLVNYFDVRNYYAVRPSFNLESSITYLSGSGSASDPMLINWLTDSFEKTSVKPNQNEVKSSANVEHFASFLMYKVAKMILKSYKNHIFMHIFD